jgi:WD40 repeat protein
MRVREIVLWETTTGAELRRFQLAVETDPPYDLNHWGTRHGLPNGIVLGFLDDNRTLLCTDENAMALDIETGAQTKLAPCVLGCAAFAVKAQSVAVYTPEGNIEIWRVSPAEMLHRFHVGLFGFRNVEVTADGRNVGIAFLNRWTLWDVASGQESRTYITDAGHIESLSFSPNGRCAVSYGNESTLKFWDLTTDRIRTVVPLPASPAGSGEDHINGNTWPNLPFAYDHAVSMLAWGDLTGVVRIWDVPSFRLVHEWPAHERTITALTFSPDGRTLYTTSVEGAAKAWRLDDESLLWSVSANDREPVFAVGCSPDGDRVAIGFGEDSSVNNGVNPSRIVDARNGETLLELDDAVRKTTLLAFTPDGREIMSGAWGRPGTDEICVRFFDANDGSVMPYTVKAIGWPFRAIAVPGSSYLLFLGTSREPMLWDLDADREVYRVQRYDVSQIAVHPDGRRFVARSRGSAIVFAIEDGRTLLTIDGCGGFLTFSVDGYSLLARSSKDQMQMLPSEDWTLTDEVQRKAIGLETLRDLLDL